MDLLVVGAGDVGRWFARTVDADVAFADADPEAAERAASALDARTTPADADDRFDAVCLAVPIGAAVAAVEQYAPRADRALLDVTGAMGGPVRAMREHAPDRERVSLHPLFAPENAPGNVAVVADAPGPATDDLRADLAAAGNRLFETSVSEHDRAMETVQASAHAAILAYSLAADDVREEFATPVSAGLDELAATVTGGTARVYREIQETFDGGERVADAAARLADADAERFEALYREASRKRFGDRPPTDETDD